MEPVRLIKDPDGNLRTPWEAGTEEYHDDNRIWDHHTWPQLCIGYSTESEWPEAVVLSENTSEEDTYSILFGLFETGQVDYKRYKREFIMPSGETFKL